MQFCRTCDNLLDIDPNSRGIMICYTCSQTYPLTTNIIMEEHVQRNTSNRNLMDIKAMCNDDTYPRIKMPCPNCKNNIVRMMRGTDMVELYLCPACKHYWSH